MIILNPYIPYVTAAGVIPSIGSFDYNDSDGDGVGSITLYKPSGVVSGDCLLLIAMNDKASTGNWPVHSGWTRVIQASSGASDCGFVVHQRIADGTEGATEVVSANATGAQTLGWYIRVTDAHQTSPVNVVGTPGTPGGGTDTHVIDEVTTTVDDCLAFYILAFDGGDGLPFSVSGAGWVEQDEGWSGSGAGEASGTWGVRDIDTAGLTTDATVTSSVTDGASFVQLAIRGE